MDFPDPVSPTMTTTEYFSRAYRSWDLCLDIGRHCLCREREVDWKLKGMEVCPSLLLCDAFVSVIKSCEAKGDDLGFQNPLLSIFFFEDLL